jgi:hypothetical protein
MSQETAGYPFPGHSRNQSGMALERIREALERNDCRPRGFPKMRAQCPVCRGTRMDTLAASPRRDGAGGTMHCFALDCDIREIVAALDLAMADLYDEPPSKQSRLRAACMPPPPFDPAPARAGLSPAEVLVKALVIERDWQCMAFWNFVTEPFRTEPSTPEQRVRLAESDCRRGAAKRWDQWQKPVLRVVT